MSPRHRSLLPPLLILLALLVTATLGPLNSQAAVPDDVARGDAAWARRGEGHRGGKAAPGPIAAAVAAYEAALAARPGDLAARWKLLRALHFKGDYAVAASEQKRAVFDRGRQLAEQGLDQLAAKVGGRKRFDELAPARLAVLLAEAGVPADQSAPLVLWSGVHWGLWGDNFGRLAAARQGVGDKVRRYAEVGLALDERWDQAAGHRMLGRLHALAPKVPLVTGWVDRDLAVAELRKAVALGPGEPLNQLYLAEALLEYQPAKKAEAQQILRRLAALTPVPERVVEDEKIRAEAQARLGG